MLNLVAAETKKIYKNKFIVFSLIVWVFIIVILTPAFSKVDSVYMLQYKVLDAFGNFFLNSLFISITSYLFSIELDYKTLKIIKAKKIASWKVYLSKLIVAISYSAILFICMYIITYLIGVLRLSNIPIVSDKLGIHLKNNWSSLMFTFTVFFKQWLASFFITTLAFLITVIFQNRFVAIIATPFIISMLSNFNYFKTRSKAVYLALPINSDVITLQYRTNVITVNERLFCLGIYSLIFIIVGIYVYKKKQVKI